MFARLRGNKPKQTYPSNKIVFILWLFPDGFDKAGQLYGLFSSDAKALLAIDNDRETFDRVPHKIEQFIVDHRLGQLKIKYWRPT